MCAFINAKASEAQFGMHIAFRIPEMKQVADFSQIRIICFQITTIDCWFVSCKHILNVILFVLRRPQSRSMILVFPFTYYASFLLSHGNINIFHGYHQMV